jgi:CRISPR-associated protein Csb3
MTEFTLARCQADTLLSHLAAYGLAAILEADGIQDVRLGWTSLANPRPVISAPDLEDLELAACVLRHAQAHADDDSWVQRDVTLMVKDPKGGLKPTVRALMSPRLSVFGDQETWELVRRSRHNALDKLVANGAWLDLRFLAALGEPSYWSFTVKGDLLQDDGASKLEMQPRNQGSEFVGNRLRKLAEPVARRDAGKVLAGLRGDHAVPEDEIGNNAPDSRTATGLAGPGPTDNALAWCALWGISQFPLAMRVNPVGRSSGTAATSGHISHRPGESFFVPLWTAQWRPARLRSILASQELRVAAAKGLNVPTYTDTQISAAQAWLATRNVSGIMRFPIHQVSDGKAAERRAMRGEPIPVRSA